MWLSFYNPNVGDVLMLTRGKLEDHEPIHESKGQITVIKNPVNQEVLAINLFGVADLKLEGQGQVFLSPDQVAQVNAKIQAQFPDLTIQVDNSPKFVVGYVEECRPHEDSDHLSVTKIRVDQDQVLQIVCGARNIDQGLKVLVAKVGAVMPSGMIIWPGQLRGVDSFGMVCSTRELDLTHIEDLPGIWELDDKLEVGTPLEAVVQAYA